MLEASSLVSSLVKILWLRVWKKGHQLFQRISGGETIIEGKIWNEFEYNPPLPLCIILYNYIKSPGLALTEQLTATISPLATP